MYRDHAFVNPSVRQATLAWELGDGRVAQGTFGVLAEEEDVRTVAKICFVSWTLGPGVPIILGHGDRDEG